MPLDATALVTLAETKAHLNIPDSDTTQDAELERFINATTAVVENHVGPVVNRDVTETVPGGGMLFLSQPPVVSLTTVSGAYGEPTTYTVGDLYLEGSSGTVHQAYGVGWFTPRHVAVTYVAGRAADTTEVPASIKLGALIIIKHLWETQRGASPEALLQGIGGEEPATFGFAFAVPNRALELLAPYRRPPVVC